MTRWLGVILIFSGVAAFRAAAEGRRAERR